MGSLPGIVFLSKDVRTARKMRVTALMNRFCGHGYDVSLISETLPDVLLDYRCDHRIKRLSFDMGVRNCSTRAEILAHFASQLPPSVFILTDFDQEAYLDYPAVIKAASSAHRVIFLHEASDGACAREFAGMAAGRLPAPGRGLRDFFEKKIYYRERQRVAKHATIQLSPEQVRKTQLLASKMLAELERICKKHGLRYYIAAGTLLGAARHGGAIPWDDDVDVTMPRPDYEKFIKIAQEELPEEMLLPERNYPFGFHRVQIRGTKVTRQIRQKGPQGISIDVAPLDGAAPTPKRKKRHALANRVLLTCMDAKVRPLPLLRADIKRLCECAARLAIKGFAPKRLMHWLWKRNATRYSTETASEWVCLTGLYGYDRECFPKAYWGAPAYLPYEGRKIPVMSEWEKYLVAHYGDYMTPPPVLCRRTHPLLAIDFGRYGAMTLKEIEQEIHGGTIL